MQGVLFLFAILFVFMYLMIIRPQRQAQRKQASMIENLKPGDEVITAGGLYGDVVEVMDDRISLEISEDIEVEVAKGAIASIIPAEAFEDAPAELEEPQAEAAEAEPVAAAQEDSGRA
jgi:preprotein translocase subunit YajC